MRPNSRPGPAPCSQLANVNAGPACLIAYWDASKDGAAREEIAPLLAAAQMAADICRHAGARAATAALQALPVAARAFGSGPALARWWRVMELLARQAAESVEPVAARMNEILAPGTIDAFENFVAAGLRAASGNKARRHRFLLAGGRARAPHDRARSRQRQLSWRPRSSSRPSSPRCGAARRCCAAFPADNNQAAQRRASIAGPLIRLPEIYRGVQGDAARDAVSRRRRACAGASRARPGPVSGRHAEAAADRAGQPDRRRAHRDAGDAAVAGAAAAVVALSRREPVRRRRRAYAAGAAGARAVRSGLCRRRHLRRQGPRDVCGRAPRIERSRDQPRDRHAARQRPRPDARAVQRQDLRGRTGLSRRRPGPVGFRRERAAVGRSDGTADRRRADRAAGDRRSRCDRRRDGRRARRVRRRAGRSHPTSAAS